MKHTYKIVLEFSSDKPLKKINKNLIQFENLLPYLYDDKINSSLIEGTAKLTREKLPAIENTPTRPQFVFDPDKIDVIENHNGTYSFKTDYGTIDDQEFDSEEQAIEEFYIDQAYGHFGSAIRDNSRQAKIEFGKVYHEGYCDCGDCDDIEEEE